MLTFTSGYMWNKIKEAPYMVVDREGRSQWMAGGFSNQYGAESQVVAVICESPRHLHASVVRQGLNTTVLTICALTSCDL